MSDKTIKEYLSYFADAHLMFAMDIFNFSVKKQINSAKKIYGVDNGLITAGGFQFSGNEGHLLENLLYMALRRQGLHLNYYVTSNGLEVDFAAQQAGRITDLYQAAWNVGNSRTRKRETRALFKAMAETGLGEATIVTYENEEMIRQDGLSIKVVPAVKFLLKTKPGGAAI